ncbi:hypothetical protein [Exiguobacterium aurantiacum]|uniref:Uncharacterized protein n=1 Tax=Exiguobacterium aurantiacum TaxID=33987 RepID=A0A377FYI4_9BACL|nr:hypothetical protein [Exiguobacterium aurantiacum]STO09556.1 Uncharacterised protein [Exiguobacterium aurantiacum]
MTINRNQKPRWVYRLRRGLLFLPAIAFAIYAWPSEPASEQTETVQTSEATNDVAYTIKERRAVEENDSLRYEYDVVVHGQPDVEALQAISHDVIDEVTARDTFQAALIQFYDHEAYIGTDSPLGQAVFGPGGDWGLAGTVEPGDYDEMSFGWQLREKEWDTQLSEDEVRVWRAWNDVYEEKDSDHPDIRSRVTRTISTKYGLEPEDVQHIVLKQNVWASL